MKFLTKCLGKRSSWLNAAKHILNPILWQYGKLELYLFYNYVNSKEKKKMKIFILPLR